MCISDCKGDTFCHENHFITFIIVITTHWAEVEDRTYSWSIIENLRNISVIVIRTGWAVLDHKAMLGYVIDNHFIAVIFSSNVNFRLSGSTNRRIKFNKRIRLFLTKH